MVSFSPNIWTFGFDPAQLDKIPAPVSVCQAALEDRRHMKCSQCLCELLATFVLLIQRVTHSLTAELAGAILGTGPVQG